MSYQVLARKWRPRNFSELVGQEHVLKALVNALDEDRLHHAFLFTGTRGVGKTTIARVLAKSLNCEKGVSSKPCGECSACLEIDNGRFVDLIEVDAASRTKVDDTRELLDNVQYAPTRGRYKVYLIDEVHMLSGHSFNALLKTLEEPPPHVKFLLATTDPQKLPVTVLSRCLQFNLKRLPIGLIDGYLEKVLGAEGIEFEAPAVELIARAADGSMRDALSLLDQAIAFAGGQLAETEIRSMLGSIETSFVAELLSTLANHDGPGLMAAIGRLDEQAPAYDAVLADIASALQRMAVMQVVPDVGAEDAYGPWRELAAQLTPEDVQLFYQIALIAKRDLALAPDPRAGFEMAMLRMLAFRPASGRSTGGTGSAPARTAARAAVTTSPAPKPAQTRSAPPAVRPSAPAPEAASAPTITDPPPADSSPVQSAPEREWREPEWSGLVESLGLRGVAHQLALNCVYREREGDVLHLELDQVHAQLVTEQTLARLSDAVARFYREPLKARVHVGKPAAETPAQKSERKQNQRLEDARRSIEHDPNVRALKDAFGAEVVDDTIRPAD